MNLFEEALNEGYEEIETLEEDVLDWVAEAYETEDGIDLEALKEDFSDLSEEEFTELSEALVKHVSATGQITKKQSKSIRSRRAVSTTGMSKTALKMRARKAARSKKRNPAGLRMAKKRRAKALKRRKSMGIK
jgi:chromatin remodeling complex protein RSC6